MGWVKQAQSKVLEIIQSDIGGEEKVNEILCLVFERQDNTDNLLRRGFVSMAIQNEEL